MTPKQAELYQYLVDRIDNPVSPSYVEMAAHLGLKSKAGVSRILDALTLQGKVTRGGFAACRTVRAVRTVNLGGLAQYTDLQILNEADRRGFVLTPRR